MLGRLTFRITSTSFNTRFASQLNVDNRASFQDSEVDPPKWPLPFEEIPEPKSLPIIGTALDYTSFRGFDITRIHEHWARRHEQYGDIYKEKLGQKYMVYCRSREDTERLFRMEGRTPYRMHLQSITNIKTIMGYPESIANETGETWFRLRQPLNKLLLKKPGIWKYAMDQREICKEGVEYIIKHRDGNLEVPNFLDFLQAWAFEAASALVLDCRFGLLKENAPDEFVEVFEGTKKMMEVLAAGVVKGIWTLKSNIGLKRSLLRSKEIILKIIEEQKRVNSSDKSLLQDIMKVESLSDIEKESLLLDMIMAAVETSANTMTLCLYCLTMSSRVQDKLRDEVKSLTPEQRSSGRAIDGMRYMNAFFKEAHRLLPFTHAFSRAFDHDVVLSGYRIPAGTDITNTINSSSNMNSDYFENPTECIPERWLDTNKTDSKFQTSGPFGMGARACPGRFVAKQEIFLFLTEILSSFEVQYHHESACSLFKATGVLSQEPRFAFVSLD